MDEAKKINWPGWEITRLIGNGSFGSVYEIQRNLFGNVEKAALKVIHIPQSQSDIEELYNDGFDEESITARFNGYLEDIIREYSLMASLKGNKNVVYCDDVRQIQHEDGIGWDIYIKMELLTPLVKTLGKTVTEDEVINIGIDMCNALVLCKEQNIVHRDIKPQNIFVSKDGVYKLGDFGIAKTAERTTSGTKTGTYKYMAPEVYKSQPYGAAADQYSLGMVLYWLLNERRTPFLPLPSAVKATTVTMEDAARKRRFDGEQIPPPAHGSKQLQTIVLRACAYDPKDRFASAAEMLEALKALKNGSASPSVAVPMGAAAAVAGGAAAGAAADEMPTGTVGTVGRRRPNTEEEVTIGAFGAGAAYASRQQGQSSTYQNAGQQNGGPGCVQPAQQGNRQYAGASAIPPQNNSEEKKKRGIGAWIAIAAGLVVVIGGVLLLTLGKGKDRGNQGDTRAAVNSHTSGSTTTLPTEPGETLPVQLDWAEWADELPAYVTDDNYSIEERTLYRSRNLETTSSTTSDKMDGWELYDTATGNGDYGAWSDWSATAASNSDSRQVETQTRYRYRDKETTTSTSSSMSGWTQYNSTTSWGDWGNWSDWATDYVSGNDGRQVETKTQYRYRDKETTTSTSSSLSGWTLYDSFVNYGAWSDWSDSPISDSSTIEVDTRQVQTGTRYYMAHYCTGYTGGSDSYKTSNWQFSSNCSYHALGWFDNLDSFYTYDGDYLYQGSSPSTCYRCSNTCYRWYIMDRENTYKTQYRYRTITHTYYFYRWKNWFSWGDTYYSSSSSREVESRTVYRYRTRSQTTTYYYYRWKGWSSWSTNAVSSNDNREVQTATFYRYRDRVTQPTYYFQRWTDWSDYTESPVDENDTVEVETKTQFRYKSKET